MRLSLNNESKRNVLLPAWIFEQAKDKEHLKQLVLEYMQRYPDYVVRSVKKKFAVCERRE